MTALQQEFKEYTLTINLSVHPEMREKSLRDYIHSQIFTDNWIGAFRTNYILATEFQFRSRPHTQKPSSKCIVCVLTPGSCLSQHDTAIRKAEREKVLSFLDELISDRVSDARKREIVESLRTQQEQP